MGMPVLSSAEGPRPFTRRQALQNARFLEMLARTGNARLAARQLGCNRSTFTKRRARSPAFAARWEAALAAAHARFHQSGGTRPPEVEVMSRNRSSRAKSRGACDESVPAPLDYARDERNRSQALRTQGGEPTIVRLKNGRLQLRSAAPGRMTKAAEQAFFSALGETANIRLAAAEAGFAHSSILARARRDPAFAHELRTRTAIAADRLVWAEVERSLRSAACPEPGRRGDYDFNPDIPIPPMTAEQAILQLTYHRQNGPFQTSRRITRPPPFEKVAPRIRAKASAIRRHSFFERTGRWRYDGE